MEEVKPKIDDCMDAGGRATQDAVAERLTWATALCREVHGEGEPKVDDCMDAGGRATQDAVAEKLAWAKCDCKHPLE